MIDPATGMKPGERYTVENLERVHPFTGFFLDGKYYLGPELLTAVGWLEGRRFIYDNLDATGEPVFANRFAGEIKDLVLTLADGTSLAVSRLEHWPPDEGAVKSNSLDSGHQYLKFQPSQRRRDGVWWRVSSACNATPQPSWQPPCPWDSWRAGCWRHLSAGAIRRTRSACALPWSSSVT